MNVPKSFKPKKKDLDMERLLRENFSENILCYRDLRIEIEVTKIGVKNELLHFDESLQRLRKAGYDRHLYPWESFELIFDFLEKNLEEYINGLAEEIVSSRGEWLSMAVKRKCDTLICYIDPENLVWDQKEGYVVDGKLEYSDRREFDITSIRSETWVDLGQFNEDIAKYFFTRSYQDLPNDMLEGYYKPGFFLPPNDGFLYPICRGYNSLSPFGTSNEGIDACVDVGISRGVLQKYSRKEKNKTNLR